MSTRALTISSTLVISSIFPYGANSGVVRKGNLLRGHGTIIRTTGSCNCINAASTSSRSRSISLKVLAKSRRESNVVHLDRKKIVNVTKVFSASTQRAGVIYLPMLYNYMCNTASFTRALNTIAGRGAWRLFDYFPQHVSCEQTPLGYTD